MNFSDVIVVVKMNFGYCYEDFHGIKGFLKCAFSSEYLEVAYREPPYEETEHSDTDLISHSLCRETTGIRRFCCQISG